MLSGMLRQVFFVYEALPDEMLDSLMSTPQTTIFRRYTTTKQFLFIYLFFISSENAVINVREFLFKSFRIFSYKKKIGVLVEKKKKNISK